MTNMRKMIVAGFLFVCAASLIAVLSADTMAQTSADQAVAASDTAAVADEDTLLTFTLPSYKYQPQGKRDPFESLAPEEVSSEDEEDRKRIKDLFSYEDASLLGIVNSGTDSYALVSDLNELSYVLRVGDRVFGGYVTDITEDAVYLHIVKYGRAMTIILRMEASKFTVIEEMAAETHIRKPGINVTYKPGSRVSGDISIEEVIVTNPYVNTIEDDWFGGRTEIPRLDKPDEEVKEPVRQGAFRLLEPQDNAWIRLPYVIDWTNAPGVNSVYTVLIDDNADFSSPLFMKEGITTSSQMVNENLGLPQNTGLYWKVIAYDQSGTRVDPVQTHLKFQIAGQ